MLKYLLLLCSSLTVFSGFSQPANDDCSNPAQLCVDQPLQETTIGATGDAASDFMFCTPSATIWYVFNTNNSGGDVTISFNNMSFNTDPNYGQMLSAIIIEAGTNCDQTTYQQRSNCVESGVDFNLTNTVTLDPNKTYYVMVDADHEGNPNNAECDFEISISGTAVDASYPTASITANNTILCEGDDEPIETVIGNCNDTASFDWYYNNTLLQSNSSGDISTTTLSEDGYLKLIMSCGTVCVYTDTTDSIFFEVTPISAEAGSDKFIQEGDVTTLEGSGEGTAEWTPGNSLTSATSFTPTANPENTTTYFLTVSNENCVASDSVTVFVGEVITVFSAFSPNGDDINDKWIIKNSAQYPDMEIVVYDRSGQVVFNTVGYSTQDKWWDGTYKDKPLPVSTYFYVIDLKIGDEGIFKGQVNIIR